MSLLLLHAPNENARASLIAKHLEAMGKPVRRMAAANGLSPRARQALYSDIANASHVVLLRTRRADTPALRTAARQALAAGKLTIARMDAKAPPSARSIDLTTWRGRPSGRRWRALAQVAGAPEKPPTAPAKRLAAPRRAKAAPASKAGGRAGVLLMAASEGLLLLCGAALVAAFFLFHG